MPLRRWCAILLLGFSSGLPLYLTGSTLKAWITKEGLDLRTIGLFSLVGLPYALKFIWAPFLDRFVPPMLGRRRGWALVFQVTLAMALVGLAGSQPHLSLTFIAVLALLVSFASASQDIVVDAWRAEALPPPMLGLGNSVHVAAYRIAMIVSGAGGLILADKLGWRVTYLIMAALMGIGVLGTLLADNTDDRAVAPRTMGEAVIEPLRELLMRPGIFEILAFALLYKIGDQLADAMTTPFLIRGMGFTLTQIGATTKTVGITFIIIGGLLGGVLMLRLTLKRALFLFGVLQACSILAFWLLSRLGPNLWALVGALALENLCYGMGGAAFIAFLMDLCDKRYTATQFALLSSLFAITRNFLSAGTGILAEHLGWSGYFLFCAIAAIPGLLLLSRWDSWGLHARTIDPEL